MSKLFISIIIFCSCLACALASSKKGNSDPLQLFKSAQDSVVIAQRTLTLETYLWRDFMPVSSKGGEGLRLVVKIKAHEGQNLPANLEADSVWVVHGNKIWSKELQVSGHLIPSEKLTVLERKAEIGPKWGPGDSVTVVVKIMHGEGEHFLLKADDQQIHRTD
jgi:hypothetical protein